jgi:hypothetical protein
LRDAPGGGSKAHPLHQTHVRDSQSPLAHDPPKRTVGRPSRQVPVTYPEPTPRADSAACSGNAGFAWYIVDQRGWALDDAWDAECGPKRAPRSLTGVHGASDRKEPWRRSEQLHLPAIGTTCPG